MDSISLSSHSTACPSPAPPAPPTLHPHTLTSSHLSSSPPRRPSSLIPTESPTISAPARRSLPTQRRPPVRGCPPPRCPSRPNPRPTSILLPTAMLFTPRACLTFLLRCLTCPQPPTIMRWPTELFSHARPSTWGPLEPVSLAWVREGEGYASLLRGHGGEGREGERGLLAYSGPAALVVGTC